MTKCLLIKTKDNRKFLTHEKNLWSLIEFSKTFGAEIYITEPYENEKILELKALTAALCNSEYNVEPKFKRIKRILPKPKSSRQKIITKANNIRNFIKTKLLEGQTVSLKQLKKKYEKQKLTDACLCNHLSVVRKTLSKDGHNFRKIGAGEYCLG